MQATNKIYSPCTLVRVVEVMNVFVGDEDVPVLVKDVITGEMLNTWSSDLRNYKHQGKEFWLMLEQGGVQ